MYSFIVMYFLVHRITGNTKHSTTVLEPLLHMLMLDILRWY